MNQTPSIGRIVHFVIPEAASPKAALSIRPAIIVKTYEESPDRVNLQVFTDAGHDDLPPVHWAREVRHDEGKAPGTWHWPSSAAPKVDVPPKTTQPAAPAPPPLPFEPEELSYHSPVATKRHHK